MATYLHVQVTYGMVFHPTKSPFLLVHHICPQDSPSIIWLFYIIVVFEEWRKSMTCLVSYLHTKAGETTQCGRLSNCHFRLNHCCFKKSSLLQLIDHNIRIILWSFIKTALHGRIIPNDGQL